MDLERLVNMINYLHFGKWLTCRQVRDLANECQLLGTLADLDDARQLVQVGRTLQRVKGTANGAGLTIEAKADSRSGRSLYRVGQAEPGAINMLDAQFGEDQNGNAVVVVDLRDAARRLRRQLDQLESVIADLDAEVKRRTSR